MSKLQRWEPTTRYIGTGEYVGDMERDDDGDWYAAADVDALLAEIRAAVKAERGAVAGLCVLRDYPYGRADHLRRKWMDDFRRRTDKFVDNSDALDSLLAAA